jgi:3-hydroxyacyl-[acyl-carrier-protein] dehydratase
MFVPFPHSYYNIKQFFKQINLKLGLERVRGCQTRVLFCNIRVYNIDKGVLLLLDINQIQSVLPHRYPFLLVDRIVTVEEGRRVVGIKNVSVNEPFFQGHYPGYPVMPGVLIIEAMAQVGATLLLLMPEFTGKIPLFAGIDKARFRRQVIPGDQLKIEVEIRKLRGRVGKSYATAYVGEEMAAEAELMFAIPLEKNQDPAK